MKRYTTPLHRFLARRSAARKAARQAALCRRIGRQFALCETDGTVGICCGTLMVHSFAETDTVGHVCQRLDAIGCPPCFTQLKNNSLTHTLLTPLEL